MTEVILLTIGVLVGTVIGVVLMCILQINRINHYEEEIMRLRKELEVKEN